MLAYLRALGAIAIGLSGVAHILGYSDLGAALMVIGTGAAAPGK